MHNRREAPRSVARSRSRGARGPRVLTALVAVAALALLAAASAASAHPQRSSRLSAGKPRWIVFVGRPHGFGVEQIYRIQASGNGLKQLTKGAYPAVAPAFSPDGRWLSCVLDPGTPSARVVRFAVEAALGPDAAEPTNAPALTLGGPAPRLLLDLDDPVGSE